MIYLVRGAVSSLKQGLCYGFFSGSILPYQQSIHHKLLIYMNGPPRMINLGSLQRWRLFGSDHATKSSSQGGRSPNWGRGVLLQLTARAEVPLDRLIVALSSAGATIHVPTSEFGFHMRSYHSEKASVWGSLDSIVQDPSPRYLECFAVNGSKQYHN